MRVLLVGTVPPPGGAAGRALAERARARSEAGDEVVVLSPDLRSAAHRHARLAGSSLAAYLAYYARRFDALEICLEDGLPVRARARGPRAALALALAALALGRWRAVTLRVEHPVAERARHGGRALGALVRRAQVVVADGPEDASLLGSLRGVDPDVIGWEPKRPEIAPAPTPLEVRLGDGAVPPGRGVVALVVYERLRHLAALALRRSPIP